MKTRGLRPALDLRAQGLVAACGPNASFVHNRNEARST